MEAAYAHTRWVSSILAAAAGTEVVGGAGGAGTEGDAGDSLGDSLGDLGDVLESDDMAGRLTKFALNKEKVALFIVSRAIVE